MVQSVRTGEHRPAGVIDATGSEPWWDTYREVITGTEFVSAFLTLGLTLISWVIWLGFGDDPVWSVASVATGWVGALVGGAVIARGAIAGLWNREVNVDELVTIAIVASLVIGEYWGAALVAFMMLFGKVLEDVTAARANDAIEGLGRMVPSVASRRDGHGETIVPVDALVAGDIVVVRPGERLPADGTVVAGQALIDESGITGEFVPASRSIGDSVHAGTLATGGALDIRVARVGEATTLGRIATLVRDAETDRAPIVRIADTWAKWFTPVILVLAFAVYLATGDFLPAVSVLVVACPCALTLATPTAIVATVARSARQGILVRGGGRLEAAGRVDAICLDKTGTLTTGQPRVAKVIPMEGIQATDLIASAARAERLSEHPLARAILNAASEQASGLAAGINASAGTDADAGHVTGFEAVAGSGVVALVSGVAGTSLGGEASRHGSAEVIVGRPDLLIERGVVWTDEAASHFDAIERDGMSPVAVSISGKVAGVIAITDTVRPHAAVAVASLRRSGMRRIILLTGDRAGPALAVARAVGIPEADVRPGLLPEQKASVIQSLREEGHRVAMVGDGVNDAPALASADVAIAMGGIGSDLTLASADVILMTDDLRQVAMVLRDARHALDTIRQNLVIATVWNVAAVALAATGLAGIVPGALIHNIGSVGVVVNAARLVGRPTPSA
jgi:Cd2+/Zn2+-exporting ATPase